MVAKNKPNEIYLTRIYDAPVKAVWDAWTDPEKAAKWWGPRGFTITTHKKDLRPGGYWDYTMHGPDGTDYYNKTIYHEVETCAKLVYDHGGHEDRNQPPLFRVVVLFTEIKGKTKLEMSFALATSEAAEETKKFIKKAGGDGTWDRLGEYLEQDASGKEIFIINRSFDAPIGKVFEVWSNPEHLAQWVPPTGFTMKYITADIRPGGSATYSMTNGQFTMYGRADYIEITKPNRLVYTQRFCDEKGAISRHPLAPTWPETMQTTVTLAEEDTGQTRVTVRWDVVGKVTREEVETFIKGKPGMTQGWTGSFDKLEAYLAKK